jgi:hypothetical protein
VLRRSTSRKIERTYKRQKRRTHVITAKRLAQIAKTSLVLPFLLAALLGLSGHANSAIHTPVSTSSHHLVDVDPPAPGY